MTTSTARPARPTLAVAATAWAVAFGLVHVLWALGWTVGLGPGAVEQMSGWFLAYDLVAAVGCFVAGRWAWTLWWPGLLLVAGVLVARVVLGVGQAAADVGLGKDVLTPTTWVEVVFLVGAVLFVQLVRVTRR
ncbi:MAG: hypothetical protein Q7T56_13820 [Nocardioidaceae bacterium]|nr:hypothetical protein [Nocardioidaceae bacterium]